MSEFKTNKISPRKGTTQTIGDSGDTLSIPCGVTVTNAGTISTAGISGGTINNSGGTISGLAGVIEWDTTAKTSGFTAVSNKGYFCNTTSAAFTVTLPASPSAGDVIAIKDYANTFDTNKISIAPNGNKIQGSTDTFESTDEGAALQLIYVDATRGWVLTDASKASDISPDIKYVVATGGTVTCCGDYKIHTFTGPGTFTVTCAGNPGGSSTVDYLVVAGGGGGGWRASAGGAGGYRESSGAASGCYTASPLGACVSALPVTATGYPITVGGGGSAGTPPNISGSNGSNSVFSSITSTGGGGGASGENNGIAGSPGGSGGASAPLSPNSGGSVGLGNTPPVSPPQGNNGGAGFYRCGVGQFGGGGGGATAVGETSSPSICKAGDGGDGATTSISASSTSYAGGGGGYSDNTPRPGGSGGLGGGGDGGHISTGGSAGGTNTGGGGGSSTPTSFAGGSGIVIIRYKYQN